jgi:Flp pilus assembly protein TadG
VNGRPLATGESERRRPRVRRGEADLVRSETGSAIAEFSLVVLLLTMLTLAVAQLALALHVRNTVLDAAAEGARFAALAGSGPGDGVARTRELIDAALASEYAADVVADETTQGGIPVIEVTVRAPLPLMGLFGPPGSLEVSGHAAVETID